MGDPKFNNKMLNYFFDHNTDVKRWLYSKYLEAQLDYFDFFSYFLNQYGIAIGTVFNIQNNTYRSYINFAPNNMFNKSAGEISLIEGVTSDEANIVLAENLIALIESSNYDTWRGFIV